jgi:hypothetical protein
VVTRRKFGGWVAAASFASFLSFGCGGDECAGLPIPPEVLVMVRGAADRADCADELVRGRAGDAEAEVVCGRDSYDETACACSLYTLADGPHEVELVVAGEVADRAEVDVVPGLCGPETAEVEFDYPPESD